MTTYPTSSDLVDALAEPPGGPAVDESGNDESAPARTTDAQPGSWRAATVAVTVNVYHGADGKPTVTHETLVAAVRARLKFISGGPVQVRLGPAMFGVADQDGLRNVICPQCGALEDQIQYVEIIGCSREVRHANGDELVVTGLYSTEGWDEGVFGDGYLWCLACSIAFAIPESVDFR